MRQLAVKVIIPDAQNVKLVIFLDFDLKWKIHFYQGKYFLRMMEKGSVGLIVLVKGQKFMISNLLLERIQSCLHYAGYGRHFSDSWDTTFLQFGFHFQTWRLRIPVAVVYLPRLYSESMDHGIAVKPMDHATFIHIFEIGAIS